jgi:hypothetical protein
VHPSPAVDSIYPDLLRTGLGQLQKLEGGTDLRSLFAALEQFRREVQDRADIAGILAVTERYVAGLDLVHAQAYYLVEPGSAAFELALCLPANRHPELTSVVKEQIRAGRFARALRRNAVVFFESRGGPLPVRGVFHSLGIASRTVGMFCGLLRAEAVPAQEVTFSLLSVLLGTCADALAATRRTADLAHQVKTLRGLLPICAWCKKIRDDQGYWKALETYVESHSDATFTHGMCPECAATVMRKPGSTRR